MKNNDQPGAIVGEGSLRQMRKKARAIRGGSELRSASASEEEPGDPKDLSRMVLRLEEARSWLEQFHLETVGMSSRSSGAFGARWAEVRKQIRHGQLDYLTREELEYGAKVAWRNSTRCVGRLSWESLVVARFTPSRQPGGGIRRISRAYPVVHESRANRSHGLSLRS